LLLLPIRKPQAGVGTSLRRERPGYSDMYDKNDMNVMNIMSYLSCISCHAWICVIRQTVLTLHKQSASLNWETGPVLAHVLRDIRSQ
jgi:hypothetical protein